MKSHVASCASVFASSHNFCSTLVQLRELMFWGVCVGMTMSGPYMSSPRRTAIGEPRRTLGLCTGGASYLPIIVKFFKLPRREKPWEKHISNKLHCKPKTIGLNAILEYTYRGPTPNQPRNTGSHTTTSHFAAK